MQPTSHEFAQLFSHNDNSLLSDLTYKNVS